jgi:hypothetical protein
MSKSDDEFRNVKKGLPPENTTQRATINFVVLFAFVGIIIAGVILLFQETIRERGIILAQSGYILEQIIIVGLLSLLIGTIQAWIFKLKIRSRTPTFIAFSILGGMLAGLVGGLLKNARLDSPFIIGIIVGALAGGISSAGQNQVMRNIKYGSKWLVYSIISWAAIFSVGWVIGWRAERGIDMALAAGLLMIASGISLAIFLNRTPEIEFS